MTVSTVEEFQPGDHVFVTCQYLGSGRFGLSGHEGPYTVVARIWGDDYKLARGIHPSVEAARADAKRRNLPFTCGWDLMSHPQCLKPLHGPHMAHQRMPGDLQ